MIKNTLLILVFLGFSNIYAQEIFIKTGKNSTTFDFSSPNNNPEVSYRSGSGNFYEVGYQWNLKTNKLAYLVSLTYNQFNASASYLTNSYSWETNYIGIQNVLSYSLYETNTIHVSLAAGFNTATIVRGDQFINTTYFDIKNNEEFAGILLQPLIGANIEYIISEKISLSLGYNYSKAYNISNGTNEKLKFNTSQFQLGIHIPILIEKNN